MESEGDITEAFDDGELAKSIESGSKGPWNDESAVFVDPKLEQLKKEMLTPEQMDYKRRRMVELQKRAEQAKAKEAKKAKPKPAPAPTWSEETEAEAPWGEPVPVWNEHGTVVASPWTERREAEQTPAPDSHASTIVRARRTSDRVEPPTEPAEDLDEASARAATANGVVVSYTPSILAAMIVFVAATLVHGAVVGWQVALIYRGSAAMLLTGIIWRRFQADRLRAMAVGAAIYGVFFVSPDRLEQPEDILAVFLGLLVVIAGAGLIGVQRDEFGTRRL